MNFSTISCVALLLISCGGATEEITVPLSTGGRSQTSTGGAGGSTSQPLTGGTSTGGQQVISTYTPQGCADAAVPEIQSSCDLFGDSSECGDGRGCHPLIRTSQDPCVAAQYYFACITVGTGTQGDRCGSSRCAAGYICVVTSAGTHCQKACDTSNPISSCGPGMRCEPIDVPGVGTCS